MHGCGSSGCCRKHGSHYTYGRQSANVWPPQRRFLSHPCITHSWLTSHWLSTGGETMRVTWRQRTSTLTLMIMRMRFVHFSSTSYSSLMLLLLFFHIIMSVHFSCAYYCFKVILVMNYAFVLLSRLYEIIYWNLINVNDLGLIRYRGHIHIKRLKNHLKIYKKAFSIRTWV